MILLRSTNLFAVAAVLSLMLPAPLTKLTAAEDRSLPPGPRGQPIRPRPPQTSSTLTPTNAATVITLPGGVVITNIPGEFLPRSTNTVPLPAVAARKFARFGYQPTSFTELSRFFPDVPEPGTGLSPEARWQAVRRQIPADVLAMDSKKVALAGFILPITLANARTTEFLLLRTQAACCFGMVPRINEIVMVKMAPPGIIPELDVPMVVGGILHLKWIGEGGQLTAIYELHADRVERASNRR